MDRCSSRTAEDFLSLFRYNRWANARVLDALRSAKAPPERAVELFSHLLRAQDIWYGRVEGTEHTSLALWETDDLETCAERLSASSTRWQTVLDGQGTEALDRVVAYTNTKGTPFETPLRDILTHVVNHGTHHRAQIAGVLREAGGEPPVTDYIFYVRES